MLPRMDICLQESIIDSSAYYDIRFRNTEPLHTAFDGWLRCSPEAKQTSYEKFSILIRENV